MHNARSVSIMIGVLVLGTAAQIPAAQADDGNKVVVSVTSAQGKVAAPGSLTWTVRITNVSSRTLTGLRLAESVVVGGDPGHGGTAPFASGGCDAAAGTAYCPLPRLAPGQVVVRRGVAKVPVRFDHGPDLLGQRVVTYEQVVDPAAGAVSQPAGLTVLITASSLPRTGTRIDAMVGVGLVLLLLGGVSVAGSRRKPR